MKLMIVVGTRPEIIKMASVIEACDKFKVDYTLVHTDQHFDENMSEVFITELGIGRPDYHLSVGSGYHGVQTGKALAKLERVIMEDSPDMVFVQGDTNTVLAGGLAAAKLGVPVGHVEAGLRHFDLRVPEEQNRRLVDHISSLLFAPTRQACTNLLNESVLGRTYVTGNTVIDACNRYVPLAEKKSKVMSTVRSKSFALVTIHRAENVDNRSQLSGLMDILTNNATPVVFPIHPRTVMRLKRYGLYSRVMNSDRIQTIPAVGYFDFLVLMKNCEYILTDSGGIQEEATSPSIRKFVFVLRDNTDRPESVDAGFAEVVGTNPRRVLHAIERQMAVGWKCRGRCPFGNGKAGEKIVRATMDAYKRGSYGVPCKSSKLGQSHLAR